jgi:hypothetical protein
VGLRAKMLAWAVGGAHTWLCKRARRARERRGGGARRADFQTEVGGEYLRRECAKKMARVEDW